MKSVDSALAADKAGDPNPLRKLQNTNAARKFAQKQLTKKFNASQPAQKFPVYEPGRRYVGDSVELDGPTIDEARRMSAAEKLGRAFDSEQQRSALSRQRGNELLKSREKENDAVKAQTKKLKGMHEEVKDMSYGKKLAKAIMAKQSKHPIAQQMGEAVKDQADVGEYDYEGDMAKSQLRSILANAQRLHDMLEDQTNLPEWVQSKITLAEDYILTAANYMEGEMNEEVEQVDEKIDLEKAKMGDVVKDFYKSKAPQFKGKSMAKRREMAVAAKLGAERDAGMREEVEQIDEISPGLARKAAAASQVKAIEFSDYSGLSNLHNKEGKKEANRLNRKSDKAMDYIGKRQGQKGVDKVNRMVTRVVGEEVVTEAEGTVAVTPKEKALAAHHGDPKKITYGDVIKARLKSAAAKKMGK